MLLLRGDLAGFGLPLGFQSFGLGTSCFLSGGFLSGLLLLRGGLLGVGLTLGFQSFRLGTSCFLVGGFLSGLLLLRGDLAGFGLPLGFQSFGLGTSCFLSGGFLSGLLLLRGGLLGVGLTLGFQSFRLGTSCFLVGGFLSGLLLLRGDLAGFGLPLGFQTFRFEAGRFLGLLAGALGWCLRVGDGWRGRLVGWGLRCLAGVFRFRGDGRRWLQRRGRDDELGFFGVLHGDDGRERLGCRCCIGHHVLRRGVGCCRAGVCRRCALGRWRRGGLRLG